MRRGREDGGFGAAFLVEVHGCRWLLGVSPDALGLEITLLVKEPKIA
jgi:hypothetical protein